MIKNVVERFIILDEYFDYQSSIKNELCKKEYHNFLIRFD